VVAESSPPESSTTAFFMGSDQENKTFATEDTEDTEK
jgi:hypothetical protein